MHSRLTSLAIDLDLLHLIAVADEDALPSQRMQAVLERELGRFVEAVNDHFAHEERVAGRGVHGDALAAQHAALRTQLEAILASARSTAPLQCQKRLLELLDSLAEHERGELE